LLARLGLLALLAGLVLLVVGHLLLGLLNHVVDVDDDALLDLLGDLAGIVVEGEALA